MLTLHPILRRCPDQTNYGFVPTHLIDGGNRMLDKRISYFLIPYDKKSYYSLGIFALILLGHLFLPFHLGQRHPSFFRRKNLLTYELLLPADDDNNDRSLVSSTFNNFI